MIFSIILLLFLLQWLAFFATFSLDNSHTQETLDFWLFVFFLLCVF